MEENNEQSLFDEYGRRIPFPGMRVYSQVSRRYNYLVQPNLGFGEIYHRLKEFLWLNHVSLNFFQRTCESLLEQLQADPAMANLAKGVHVPFVCLPVLKGFFHEAEIRDYVKAAGTSFEGMFPKFKFRNFCEGKPDGGIIYAPDSRYENFQAARTQGPVVGWYFPNCLSEYDVDSQRRQMTSLPQKIGSAQIALSGAVEAAAALVGSPDLLSNKNNYPHHLCLSALVDPDPKFIYMFEAYDPGLAFNRRSNMLTPDVTQMSESWAGGLTVYME